MRVLLNVLGCSLIVMGAIWILQGINILPGSFMTGQIQWAYRGGFSAFIGIIILLSGNLRRIKSN